MLVPPKREDFTANEWRIVERCRTPLLVQRWLRTLPYNYERGGETVRTFRQVVRLRTAHCLEGALSAATILEQHGYPPLLLDLESKDDLDHVLFLHRQDGRWGSVATSHFPGLHGRKPVFRTVRDLARSYLAPYVDEKARVTGFGTLDLRTLARVDWRFSERNVWKVQDVLIEMPHARIRMPEREYRFWRERYGRYKRRHPDAEPTYYPGRRQWL